MSTIAQQITEDRRCISGDKVVTLLRFEKRKMRTTPLRRNGACSGMDVGGGG